MDNKDDVTAKSKKVHTILDDCSTKLNSIEMKQSEVVKKLNKQTDDIKISKVKKEIEAL